MSIEDTIHGIFVQNGGIVRASELRVKGIHSIYITRLLERGKIARIRRGVYEWIADGGKSDAEILAVVLPEGVVCLHSALNYYGYIDRTPPRWHIALDKNRSRWRSRLMYPALRVHYVPSHLFPIGRTRATFEGEELWIYDRERTICDVLRYAVDPEIMVQSIRAYVQDPKRRPDRLTEYAAPLRVKRMVEERVAIWL